MIAVFDGHNDALTREDHARLGSGRERRPPRPSEDAGRRGARRDLRRVHRLRGRARGAAPALRRRPRVRARAAGRARARPRPTRRRRRAGCIALEREGHVAIARRIEDLDRAPDGDGAPGRDPPPRGRGGDRSRARGARLLVRRGLRTLGPVWSRSNAFGHGVPFIFPSSPDTGPGLTRGRAGARAPVRGARDPDRPQPPQRGGVLGCRGDRAGAARRQPLRRPRALRRVAQPHRRPARRDRRQAAASSGSCSRARSSAPTSPRTPTRRSS